MSNVIQFPGKLTSAEMQEMFKLIVEVAEELGFIPEDQLAEINEMRKGETK